MLLLLCGIASLPAAFLPSGGQVLTEVRITGAPLGLDLETKAGRPFDLAALRRDVRALWATQRYSDIQVFFNDQRDGLYFHLEPHPRYRLRSVLFEPRSEARPLQLEPGAEIDRPLVQRLAAELRHSLAQQGFRDASVEGRLLPLDAERADILFRVDPGDKLRVSRVRLEGPLRKHAEALKPLTILPGIRRLSKAYSDERLDEDLRRLRAALLADGRFDAQVRPSFEPVRPNRIDVAFEINAGPRYQVSEASITTLDGARLDLASKEGRFPTEALCTTLMGERSKAERAGRLDFAAQIEIRPLPPADGAPDRAAASAGVQAGEPIRARWIGFEGAPDIRDTTLRRALQLDEGDLLDGALLRRSLARLNRFTFLQPVSSDDVAISEVAPGLADITIHLKQQNARRWTIGGPLGPMSLFGPIHGKLETRLPPWGRGLLELSTYTVGGLLTSVPRAVLENDAWVWKTIWQPSLVLSRPPLPGQPWTSGYLWSPQLRLKQALTGNAAMRFRSNLGSLLDGPPPAPPLRVPVRHVERGLLGELDCSEGRSWTDYFRTAGRLAFAVAGL